MTDGFLTETVASWPEFLERVEALEKEPPPLKYFRGQARAAEWSLQPRLARVVQGLDEKAAREVEDHIRREFQTQVHLYVTPRMVFQPEDVVSQWGLMQHYGAPTRLLDWTASPYVAAYFAVRQHADSAGAIWVLKADRVQKAMLERYGKRADLPRRVEEQKALLMELEGEPVLHFTFLSVRTDRMGAQQMSFTMANRVVCDHADLITRSGQGAALTKLVIPASLKPIFMRRLLRMNITGFALFPGIDGLGAFATELAEIERAHRLGFS